jgi:hypothetical protein
MLPTQPTPKHLIWIGLVILTLHPLLQRLVGHSAYASDLSDFALGVLFGVGVGVALLGLWRDRRGGGHPTGASGR